MPFPVDPDDPILTTASAARLLGVAISTTQLWLESGALPSWKTPGGHRRVRTSAVLNFLDEKLRQKPLSGKEEDGVPDPDFLPAPGGSYRKPADERARLAALRASGLVDVLPDAAFERLAWLAAQVTGCPIGLVTLLTSQRQWFKARSGTDLVETPRDWAFCNHTILQAGPFVVGDAAGDPRFADNPLVTGEPYVRFYAGVRLVDAGGHALGALCVLDREARRLRGKELKALEELAAITTDHLRR